MHMYLGYQLTVTADGLGVLVSVNWRVFDTEKRALRSASRPVLTRRVSKSLSRPHTAAESCASNSISAETGQFTSPDLVTSH